MVAVGKPSLRMRVQLFSTVPEVPLTMKMQHTPKLDSEKMSGSVFPVYKMIILGLTRQHRIQQPHRCGSYIQWWCSKCPR